MKKMCLILLSLYSLTLNAQLNPWRNITYEKIGVEVFSEPNYGGTRVNLRTAGLQTVSFNIRSMKIPNGYTVYSKNGNECGFAGIYTSSGSTGINRPDILQCAPMNSITILRTPSSRQIEVILDGITSNIHNGDCQRFYGNVSYSIRYEGEVIYNLNLVQWEKGPVRNIGNNSGSSPRYAALARSSFVLDEAVLNQCQIVYQVNLGSAHKGCDLCTDFTWEAKMPQLQILTTNLNNALARVFTAGPYRTSDNRHEIRAFFQVRRL